MKLYHTFLLTILLTAFVALMVYNAGIGGQDENTIPGTLVMAGVLAFNDESPRVTVKEKQVTPTTNVIQKKDQPVTKELDGFYADEWIKSWFSRFDQDDDKFITKKEFLQNIEPFPVKDYHLNIFTRSDNNPDGVLNLFEFNNFIDSTKFLTKHNISSKASPVPASADDIDPVKLIAGALAIGLLMAAFKLV